MSSIIPGYDYDIFISYRQKDNKGDKWVSRFIEALKTELEATFKEDVSVYFDENPHDRLQETHNVDKSLEGKLKCIIIIPILSQTYCDPGSYAWQYEFLAFNKLAKEDRFGRDIRLRGGNYASRILPIRIHDLEQEDVKLFEKETGNVLRAMDFVFRTASGVNRPLKVNEDIPQDNLNKTFYGDQINKVAHAIKEIIQGMKAEPVSLRKEKAEQAKPLEEVRKEEKIEEQEKTVKTPGRKLLIAGIVIAILLIIVVILAFPWIFKNKGADKLTPGLEKSIAVLPFINDSQDTTNVYFINGIMEGILNNLSKIKDLKVLSRTSVEQYRNNKTKSMPQIAAELGVNYIVEGSGQKYGDRVMLSIQLLEAGSDKHLFSESYDRKLEDIFNIQSEIASSVATSIRAVITPEETELIDRKPTTSMAALNMCLRGIELSRIARRDNNQELYRQAESCFKRAIHLDSTYSDAYRCLGWRVIKRNSDSALYLANRALHFDDKNANAYSLKAAVCSKLGLAKEAEDAAKLALKYNPNDGVGYSTMGFEYWKKGEYGTAVEYILKAIQLEKEPDSRRGFIRELCRYLYAIGFYEEALKYAEELIKYDNDSLFYYKRLLVVSNFSRRDYPFALKTALKLYGWDPDMTPTNLIAYYIYAKDYTGALKQVEEYIKIKEKQGTKIDPSFTLGYVYLKNGQKEKSVYHIEGDIRNRLKTIEQKQPNPGGLDYVYLAAIYSAMDDKVKAIESLRKALKCKDIAKISPWIINSKNYPMFDTIRDEPEIQEFFKSAEDWFLPERKKIEKLLQEEGIYK